MMTAPPITTTPQNLASKVLSSDDRDDRADRDRDLAAAPKPPRRIAEHRAERDDDRAAR